MSVFDEECAGELARRFTRAKLISMIELTENAKLENTETHKYKSSHNLAVRRIQEDFMAEIIGVRFKEVGKVYYFDPLDNKLNTGDRVIVETARGLECGEVATPNKTVDDAEISHPLKPLIRIATEKDLNHLAENKLKEKEAYRICEQKIANHKLEMKLVNVEYTFDNSKILFYFTADGRVDFRALVKDLASVFRTRIELRQIGVRDEAKMLGGLGICGKPSAVQALWASSSPFQSNGKGAGPVTLSR